MCRAWLLLFSILLALTVALSGCSGDAGRADAASLVDVVSQDIARDVTPGDRRDVATDGAARLDSAEVGPLEVDVSLMRDLGGDAEVYGSDIDDASADTGAEPPCVPACAEPTPVCDDGRCVQCTGDAHCPPGCHCDVANGRTACVCTCDISEAPYLCPDWLGCCQCTEDLHCGQHGLCDTDTGRCVDDPCEGRCVLPYPACAIINGTPSCVPCTEDQHCIDAGAGSYCDPRTFFCSCRPICGGQMCMLNGCPSDGGLGTLVCDGDTGCCHGEAGYCDGVRAYCNPIGGGACVLLAEVFPEGSVPDPGIPGFPVDADIGFCTCDAQLEAACAADPELADCRRLPQCWPGTTCWLQADLPMLPSEMWPTSPAVSGLCLPDAWLEGEATAPPTQ